MPSGYVNKLTITKKPIFTLWITSKVIISNNTLPPKCYTCNIFEFLYPLATTERPGMRCR